MATFKAMPNRTKTEKEARSKFEHKHGLWGSFDKPQDPTPGYELYSPASVYYDDVTRRVKADLAAHNRIIVILQGLLDRSDVFAPHPKWSLWTPEHVDHALRFVYDDHRALTPGEAPDFEAYHARLAALITKGSITIGQDPIWARSEAQKLYTRGRLDAREREFYRPYGNSGPGAIAEVARASRKGECLFEWSRERLGVRTNAWGKFIRESAPIRCTLSVPREKLFNVSAYTPGEYRKFFADPRTRADYLKWAPLLLEAEEYHAGNRKVGPKGQPGAPKDEVDDGGE